MSAPNPPVPIVGGCSVVVNDTLYVYSPDAFQALPLKSGGNWTQLANGVPVTGAACVKGYMNGTGTEQALWIVGGANNASNPNYPGLQRYLFTNQTWQTITPTSKITQNRQNHGAAFLNESSSILVYAGSQQNLDVPSSETFLISTIPPYSVSAYTAKNYPALSPIVLPWNNNSAITLGGDNWVPVIYHFDPDQGWKDLGLSVNVNLNSTQTEQGLLVQGSDNSKVLELYNLGTSPNLVSRIVLQDANGKIAPMGETVGAATSRKRKRQSLNDWPAYNASNAPTTPRSGYSLAQGSDGLVAITGGDSKNPVELFNQQSNAWVDPATFFASSASTTSPSSSSSPSSTSSATSTPSSTNGAIAGGSNNHPRTSLLLGAILGSVLGFIALLLILLLLIRWRRRRRRVSRESTGSDEKGRLSFADRGAPFMKEAGGAGANPVGATAFGDELNRERSRTLTSQSSGAPLVPRGGRRTPQGNGRFGRGELGVPSVILETPSNRNSANSKEAIGNRGSGWSGYFFGKDKEAKGLTPQGSTLNIPATVEKPGTYLSYEPMKTGTSGSASHDCNAHGPTEIPPLALGQTFDTSRVSSAVTGLDPNARIPTRAASARTQASGRPSTDAPSTTMTDTVFTAAPVDEFGNHWTPVTMSDMPSRNPATKLPLPVRDTKSSSFYGNDTPAIGSSSTPAMGFSSPKASEPMPSTSPGYGLRKSDGSLWGEPGPMVGEDGTGFTPPKKGGGIGVAKTTVGDETVDLAKSAKQSDMSWLKIPGA